MADTDSSSASIVAELTEGKINRLETVIKSIRGSDATFREKFQFLLKILTLCRKVKVKKPLLKTILGLWGDSAVLPRLLSVISTPDSIINYVLGTLDTPSAVILSTMVVDITFRPGDLALVTNRLEHLKNDERSKELHGIISYENWVNLHQYVHAGIINAMNVKDEEKRDEDTINYLQTSLAYIQGRLSENGSIMIPPWVFRNKTDYFSSGSTSCLQIASSSSTSSVSTSSVTSASSSSTLSSQMTSSGSITSSTATIIDPKSILEFPYITDDVYAQVKQIMENNLRLSKKVDAVKIFVMTAPKWELDNLLKSKKQIISNSKPPCTHSTTPQSLQSLSSSSTSSEQVNSSSLAQKISETKCSCHHDDVVEETPISPNEMLSFRYWGPVNNTIGYPCQSSPTKDGTCHMLTCCCHEESDENWFTGTCDNCDCKIGDISHAVRFPHPDGGWVGCYHSFTCMEEHLSDDMDKEDVMRLERFKELIDIYGVYNRYDGKDKIRKWSGEPVHIYDIPD